MLERGIANQAFEREISDLTWKHDAFTDVAKAASQEAKDCVSAIETNMVAEQQLLTVLKNAIDRSQKANGVACTSMQECQMLRTMQTHLLRRRQRLMMDRLGEVATDLEQSAKRARVDSNSEEDVTGPQTQ